LDCKANFISDLYPIHEDYTKKNQKLFLEKAKEIQHTDNMGLVLIY
jgi:hypothetical protein